MELSLAFPDFSALCRDSSGRFVRAGLDPGSREVIPAMPEGQLVTVDTNYWHSLGWRPSLARINFRGLCGLPRSLCGLRRMWNHWPALFRRFNIVQQSFWKTFLQTGGRIVHLLCCLNCFGVNKLAGMLGWFFLSSTHLCTHCFLRAGIALA